MRRFILGVGALIVVVALIVVATACSPTPSQAEAPAKEQPFFIEVNHKLSDGRTVLCLYRQEVIGGHSYGMTMTTDCDWDNAKVIK